MNVLLINPSQSHVYGGIFTVRQIPLGLAYIAAALRQAGHRVEIIDINTNRISEKALRAKLINGTVGLAGITTSTPTYNNALLLARIVKECCRAYVVLGGVHVTVLSEEALKTPYVDFVVAGEGELTILELIRALEDKGDFTGIDGLVFKKEGRVIVNKPRDPVTNLDSLPFPARDLFPHNKYTYPDSIYPKTAPIVTSRGCFGKCTYCLTPVITGGRVRFRSAKNVVDEIDDLRNKYKIQEIHFWDDNFIGLKNRVFEIRDELKRRNIRLKYAFPNGIRADFVTDDILRALKDMGTYSLAIGVESGSQEILDSVNKNIKLGQIIKVFDMLKKYKFETWAFFMLGLPKENKESIYKTISFAKAIDPDVAKFHIFKPFPGMPIFNDLKDRNLITDFNYDNYSFYNEAVHQLENIDAADILRWQKIAYREFYLSPKKIISHLLRLKSLHRAKQNALVTLFLIRSVFLKKAGPRRSPKGQNAQK